MIIRLQILSTLVLALFFSVTTLSAQYSPMFSNFGGGSGVENDPFLITSLTQFNNLRTIPSVPLSEATVNRHFKLAADLDLSTEAAGEGWVPINVTHITLDGDGHTIRNLTIARENATNQGLFGILTRVHIKNLNIESANIEVGSTTSTEILDAGILAGTFTTGTINDLYVQGTVSTKSGTIARRIGGVMGQSSGSTLNRITTNVTVSGTSQIGGIAGLFQADVFVNFARVTANLTGTQMDVGGIAGQGSSSHVNDSVTDVDILANSMKGGVFGRGGTYQIRRTAAYARLVSAGGASFVDSGGIVGFTNSGSSVIDNVFVVGGLTGNNGRSGGIIGSVSSPGTLSISRVYARFDKSSGFGCLYGSGSLTILYAYFDNTRCTTDSYFNETSRTPEQLRDNANYHFSFFDAGSPWLRQDGINDGVPYLTDVPLKATVSISPTAGWRMMGSPAAVSYAQLLGPVWTQGATGSNAPSFPQSNVFEMQADPGTGSLWNAVTDLNTTTTPGRGFIYFHFNDNNNDGTPNTAATSLGMLVDTPQDPIRITTTGAGNGEIDDWMLLANPYNATIRFRDLELRETAQVMYIYTNTGADITAQDAGNPQYIAWNEDLRDGSATNGLIAPFQGFLVWGETSGSYVEFATSAIVSDAAELRQRELPSRSLSLQIQGENRTNRTHFTFGLDGSLDADRKDALLLQPMASTWLSMFSMLGDQAMDIQHLPYHPADVIDLPIGIRHMRSGVETGGQFTIALAEAHNIPDDWQILLIDNVTGDFVDLRDESHELQHQPNTALAKSRNAANELIMAANASDGSTLMLRIIPSATPTSVEVASDLPVDVVLAQNYPNPFNPTTTLQFALPSAMDVRLEVYNMVGQRVATVADGQHTAGWHSVQFDGSGLSSGVYIYRLTAAGQSVTRKFSLIK